MTQPISLNDIAKHLGISQMTVSRVINRSGSASAATTARVLAAAQELGYRRDVFASINAKKRNPGIGGRRVLVDWVAEPPDTPSAFSFYSLIVVQVIAELEKLGCHTVLTDLTRQGAARTADLAAADAVVFCSPVADSVIELVECFARTVHHVSLFQEQPGALAVNPDNALGGRLAAELLHRHGHHHVAIYTTPDQMSQVERRDGCQQRLRQLDPTCRIELIEYRLHADGVTASLAEMQAPLHARWQADSESLPSAIFVPGGYATFALYRFLRARAVAIPQQMGVIGFDSLAFYDAIDTPLSHISFELSQIVSATVATVMHILAAEPHAIVTSPAAIPCHVDDRGSLMPLDAMRGSLSLSQ